MTNVGVGVGSGNINLRGMIQLNQVRLTLRPQVFDRLL
jgi:hypothetical protein